MIEKLLSSCLGPVVEAETRLRRRWLAIGMIAFAALVCATLALVAATTDWWSWKLVLAVPGSLLIIWVIGYAIIERRAPDLREIARRIEEKHPDLQAALLAAMDQKPAADGSLSFLQRKLLGEISEHAIRHRWVRQVSKGRLAATSWANFAAVVALFASIWFLLGEAPQAAHLAANPATEPAPEKSAAFELSVTPGDVELEKGSRLVVEAKFKDRAPGEATLIHRHAGGETRLPMQVGLDDAVFSTLITRVDTDGSYRVEYSGEHSPDYAITTFEYPELSQADAVVTPPAYLGGDPETITDTRKITVMEGAKVRWRLKVNKPVTAAEMFGEDGEILSLEADPADPTVLVADHQPDKTQKYRVHLVDEKDRANRRPPWLTVNVKENLPPQWKLTFPGRDFEVSALQELPLEAEVWDDVGVLRAGVTWQFQDQTNEIILTDAPLEGEKTTPLATQLDIEKLDADERDFISYHFWAEDKDKDGQVRRSASDEFFAEVRLFEEIVREGAPGGGQGQGGQGQTDELLKIQKEILSASWKLIRSHQLGRTFETYGDDVGVLHESQNIVIGKTDEVFEKVEDPEVREALTKAREAMNLAAAEFASVMNAKDGAKLPDALKHAKEAYSELLKARARETEISMSQSQSSGQSQQERQRNLNLELQQKELKYQENSAAETAGQTPEQQENLAVLNRLKDLARRQEAIAKKIKELENQLQNASGKEKEEIERQLKRLQEEQRELLRELDDLSERMDKEENRANFSEERKELDETRESVQESAEKLESGELADAANAATRAGEQLEEMKEQFREKTSKQFAKEMQGLRDSVRELAENQSAIGEQLDEMTEAAESGNAQDNQQQRGELAEKLAAQQQKLEESLESMRQLSEQAEPTEPLLSDALYEAVRNAMMNDIGDSLGEARDMTYYNQPGRAGSANEVASRGIKELQERVEKAAEKILGNEADSLRLARSELDKLIEQSQDEANRIAGSEGKEPKQGKAGGKPESGKEKGGSGEDGEPSEEGQVAGPTGSGQPKPGEEAKPGEEGEGQGEGKEKGLAEAGKGKGEGKAKGEGQEAGTEPGEGEGEGEGQGESQSLAESGKEKGKGKGKGKGQSPGEGEGETQGQGQGQGQGQQRQLAAGGGNSGGGGALNNGGDDRNEGMPTGAPTAGSLFFDDSSEERLPGPITGEDYEQWSDRLANIEEMLPQEDLRNSVAQVRDDARAMRIDYRRDDLPPGAATIRKKITEPLVELRQRLSEEIARLNRENPLAPIDRDPVPSEFRDLVRRYYEELGAGN